MNEKRRVDVCEGWAERSEKSRAVRKSKMTSRREIAEGGENVIARGERGGREKADEASKAQWGAMIDEPG